MALIEHTMFGKVDKVQAAIEHIKRLDPLQYSENPYYVAYSGGKDSDAIRILMELSGVKYDLVHNHTTADAPETVRYVRSIPGIQIEYPDFIPGKRVRWSMWSLIVKKGMPPTRIARYCCEKLKERGGRGRTVVMGIRAEESSARKSRTAFEIVAPKKEDGVKLNIKDVDASYMEAYWCKNSKYALNPIIDWSEAEVWEFLRHYGCESNPLYQEGYSRVGCVGCPMAQVKDRLRDFRRHPKYKALYINAFDKMLDARPNRARTWRSGEDVFDWWVRPIARRKPLDGQLGMEDDDYAPHYITD